MSKPNFTPYGSDTEAITEARKYTQANGLRDPYRAYAAQRNSARIRGIGWEFAFASWWAIWQPYFHMRGPSKNHLCMARELDEGPYSPDNVYLTTNMGNSEDYQRRNPARVEERRKRKEAREMRFARSTPRFTGSKQQVVSDMTRVAFHGEKSTCNYRDELLEWELSAL